MANETLSVRVGARINEFRKKMAQVANTIRTTSVLAGNAKIGSALALSPTLSPMIASTTAAVGGLGTSFLAAGTSAGAFGALAITSLTQTHKAGEALQKLQDKLASTDDEEKRAEILAEIAKQQENLTDKQKEYLQSVKDFSSFWKGFAKQFETPVLDIVIQGMKSLKTIIEELKPVFEGSVKAVQSLMTSFDKSLKTDEVQKFFDFIGKKAGPSLVAMGKSFGNIFKGIMNLMVAFGPLAGDMENGLLKLTERFAKWTASLGQSEGFQKFVDYVKVNGPVFLSVIGQLGLLIENLLTAMAPMGAILMEMIQRFLQFTNETLKANPAIGIIIVGIVQMIGVIKLLMPVLSLLKIETMKTMATKVAAWTAAKVAAIKSAGIMVATIVKTVAKYAWMGVQALLHAAKVAASWFIALGPVGWVIGVVVGLVALIIANWDKVKAVTIKVFGAVWTWLSNLWTNIVNAVKQSASNILGTIKDRFNAVVNFLLGLRQTFLNAGKGLIEMIAKGILNGVSKVTGAIKSVTSKIRNFLPFSPAKEGPLKDLNRLDFGGPIKDSIRRAQRGVQASMTRLVSPPAIEAGSVSSSSVKSTSTEAAAPDNFRGLFDGATFNVRNDQDIKEIAFQTVKLIERLKTRARGGLNPS